ncbi:hypothetical protein DL768_009610 [Monosporascus sp. mg162]|nr:hypothetical protein DL768_009610 [Monosporascus sp. mg162]
MVSSKNNEKNARARRAATGGVNNKTGEGPGQQATTAAAGGTPASSGSTTSPDMDAARAELDALLESLGATGPDTAATAQEQEEQRQTLHHYLSQALNQDLNQGGTPLLSVSTASPDMDSSDAELDRQGQDHDGNDQDEEKADDDKEADDENLLDRHNRTVAQILTRFRNVIAAATEPLPREGAVLEHAALNRFTMQTEMAALLASSSPSPRKPSPNLAPASQITEVQNLLALNREIKALWIRGPLRKPGENDGLDAEIDRRSVAVADMYQKVLDMFEEKKKAEARAGASSSALGGEGQGKDEGKEVKGEEGVKKESQYES